ncbi:MULTISPECIES: cyclophilin-like fold protein [Bacteroidaceae]|uniref:cyclophilin-like fold protein n=1 Tax=Bacteroidaceae TaxID=815 RepID=UPI0031FEFE91
MDYSCIVLFYETFSSGYSHTRLGQIDNPEGLAAALGDGYVSVRFAITKSTDRNI